MERIILTRKLDDCTSLIGELNHLLSIVRDKCNESEFERELHNELRQLIIDKQENKKIR